MFKNISIVLFGLSALAGCDTRNLGELTYAEQQEMLVKFKAACAEAGAPESSPQHDTCVQTEIIAENAKRHRQKTQLQDFGEGLSAAGNNYSASVNANAAAAQARRPITCVTSPTTGWGSSTTTCN